MNKKGLWISGTLIIVIAIVSLTWVGNKKTVYENQLDKSFADIEGVLIYSNWDAYIYSYQNDLVRIQIPVYEFNNALVNGYGINIKNFDIGEFTNINLELKNQFKHFNQYILHFNLIPKKTGNFHLDRLKIEIESSDQIYEGKLGDWIFEIVESSQENHLSIIGGSLFSHWEDIPMGFQHRSELYNKTNKKIKLEEIIINHEKFNTLSTTLNELAPNEKIKISTDIDVSKSYGNVLIKPKLVYSIEGNYYELPLNQTIFASLVPLEELNRLIDEKGLNTKNEPN